MNPFWLLACVLAAAVAVTAFRLRALSRSGMWAAGVIGAVVLGGGGWATAAALLTFFGTSTALSRWRRGAKLALGYEKGGRRDAGQVLANGGVAAAAVLLARAAPALDPALLFLGALAAANADTWATEVGSALSGAARDLRTGKPVPRGTSGAISGPGTLAALAGAAVIGLFAGSLSGWMVVTLAGLGGSLVDSLLGATVQARWRISPEGEPWQETWTEVRQPRPPDKGWLWVSNDVVNALCTLCGSVLGWGLGKAFL